MTERTLERTERGYKNMVAIAKMLEAVSPHDAKYTVEDTYLDYGLGWMWTTICRRGFRECQILCPRDWKSIMVAETTQDLAEIADVIRADKFFVDK